MDKFQGIVIFALCTLVISNIFMLSIIMGIAEYVEEIVEYLEDEDK